MAESAKALLLATVTEWTKFSTEREKMRTIANEVAMVTRYIIKDHLAFFQSKKIEVACENAEDLRILGVKISVDPIVEETFPTVKASVALKCGGASRFILINANTSISAGGPPFMFEELKRGVPETFVTNAAEFVRDAFLNVARTGSTPAKQ
jgi:hypothetical protein